MRKLVGFSWKHRAILHPVVMCMLMVAVVAIGFNEILLGESQLKYLWLFPLGFTLTVLEELWNPFKIAFILAVFGIGYSVEYGSAVGGIISCIACIASLVLWYVYIQRASDA